MSTQPSTSMMSVITPSLRRLSHNLSYTTRRALGVLLLCSSSLFGCDSPSEPSHHISDNIVGDVISFGKDQLEGRYLTESTIQLRIARDDLDEREGLSITSSDPDLLRLTEVPASEAVYTGSEACIGAACDRSQASTMVSGHFSQYFEVLAPGTVTLTFRDGDEVVLKRDVELVEASSLEASRFTSEAQPEDIDPTPGRGEKILNGSSHTIRLIAKIRRGEAEETLGFSTITELPSGEGVQVDQAYLGFSSGINLFITPEREGQLTVPVEVGGERLELNFDVVSASEIERLEVTHAPAGDYQVDDQQSVPLGSAVAVARDGAGELIFGGDVTWARLDDSERELEVYYGDRLDFELQEGERVPFRVTLGEHSEIVYLPMNPNSTVIFGGDAFNPGGCDAKGQLIERSPLLLILLALIALRRRAHA